MESASPKPQIPSRKGLENYAVSYVGAYLNAVKKERPERAPSLARNQPYEIEVCLLPNNCFCMLFEKAERQSVNVSEKGWSYVEGKISSGIAHLVAVYAHEGVTVADAIAKGKKDAVRDVRSLEDSSIAHAVSQLEKILDNLTHIELGNKSMLGLAETELAKLQPIKDAVVSTGPEVDMLALVDALKNYPAVPIEVNIDIKEKDMLESLTKDLGDLSDLIRRVETQDARLEEMEQVLKKTLSELNRSVDERISKGLAVILQSSDKKIDKGLSTIGGTTPKGVNVEELKELVERLRKLEEVLKEVEERRSVADELVLAVSSMRENLARLNSRITNVEGYVSRMGGPPPPKQRRLSHPDTLQAEEHH